MGTTFSLPGSDQELMDAEVAVTLEEPSKGALQEMVIAGDTDGVRFLVACGENLEGRYDDHKTILHLAVLSGRSPMVQYLIGCGALVNVFDKNGYPPISYALDRYFFNIAEILLKAGASFWGIRFPIMHPLVYDDKIDSMQFLIIKGDDIHAKGLLGESVAHCAFVQGNMEAIARIIECGGDINAQNCYGETPLHLLLQKSAISLNKKISIIEKHFHRFNFCIENSSGETVIDYAFNDYPDIAQIIESRLEQQEPSMQLPMLIDSKEFLMLVEEWDGESSEVSIALSSEEYADVDLLAEGSI